ncbi:MAG: hypothetical protein AAFO63_00410 [Pseudomonadota bacterium]
MPKLSELLDRHPFDGTDTVRIAATPDQIWALDPDHLYDKLEKLKPVGRHYVNRIHMLEAACDVLLVAAVLSIFFVHWAVAPVLVFIACAQRLSNRKLTAELAGKAATQSAEVFYYLYNTGALWLEQSKARDLDEAREHLWR